MASFQRKYLAYSTEQKLKKFFSQNLFFTFLLTIIALIFCIATEKQYERSSRQQLELNYFYLQFEKLHSALHSYSSGKDETLSLFITESFDELEHSLSLLQNINIDTIYHRDIEDVTKMLVNYKECSFKILSYGPYSSNNNSVISEVNHYYYKAQEIYQSINSEFRSLYSQILEFARITMEQMRQKHKLFIVAMTLILLFMTLGEFSYSIILSHMITDPIKELTSSIRGFNMQKLTDYHQFQLSSDSNAEMNVLVHVFNMMLHTIQEQVKKIQENTDAVIKLHQKEVENLQITNLLRSSELKALQMQINPHFLFNTLNMVSQTAYIEEADQTSMLLDSTAALLRYTLDFAGRSVPLSKEIEILGLYVSLQEQRFGGRIRFTFDLDETFHHVKVPSLILQPLVENAITHGIGMYLKDAFIIIRTEYDLKQKMGTIRIIDNGVGMEPILLEKVCMEMKQSQNAEQKIGLSNVYARLGIFFCGKAQMEIYSTPYVKTEVIIRLPCTLNPTLSSDIHRS